MSSIKEVLFMEDSCIRQVMYIVMILCLSLVPFFPLFLFTVYNFPSNSLFRFQILESISDYTKLSELIYI